MKIQPLISFWVLNATCMVIGGSPGDALLDAGKFPSLGVFEPATDVSIDVRTGLMSGGASFQGVQRVQGGVQLMVFTFSCFTLNSNVNMTCSNAGSGSPGIAILSKGDMIVMGNISVDGFSGRIAADSSSAAGLGGPGGDDGGKGKGGGASGYYAPPGTIGFASIVGGGGGGFGGVGGGAGFSEGGFGRGGLSYNPDLSSELAGGSGGGFGPLSTGFAIPFPVLAGGGGGGGSLELGALGALEISGFINARGGQGADWLGNDGCAGGGGSGGGVLLHADTITILTNGVVSVRGGGGGSAFPNPFGLNEWGGGGGGGRVYIAYKSRGTVRGKIDVSGGLSLKFSQAGGDGTYTSELSALVPIKTTIIPTLTGSLMADGRLALTWPDSVTGFTLQTTADLTNHWIDVPDVRGSFATISTVTNQHQYFRLYQSGIDQPSSRPGPRN